MHLAVGNPEAGNHSRKNRWANIGFDGSGIPTEKKLGCCAANTPLARSHAAARLQFGIAPTSVLAQSAIRNIFTAAN